MSEVPDIVIDAADVGAGGDIPWDVAARIAERLNAAGLLCTPPERAVINAAIAETDAEDAPQAVGVSLTLRSARKARRVAVAEHKAAS